MIKKAHLIGPNSIGIKIIIECSKINMKFKMKTITKFLIKVNHLEIIFLESSINDEGGYTPPKKEVQNFFRNQYKSDVIFSFLN